MRLKVIKSREEWEKNGDTLELVIPIAQISEHTWDMIRPGAREAMINAQFRNFVERVVGEAVSALVELPSTNYVQQVEERGIRDLTLDQKRRADQLANEVMRHRTLYTTSTPELSDSEFDSLVADLRSLDPIHPVLGGNGP